MTVVSFANARKFFEDKYRHVVTASDNSRLIPNVSVRATSQRGKQVIGTSSLAHLVYQVGPATKFSLNIVKLIVLDFHKKLAKYP